MHATDAALVELGRTLQAAGYRFRAVTPETHRRVLARDLPARTPRDVFGWNRPFTAAVLPAPMLRLMERADIVREGPEGLRSGVRWASLGNDLFVHSAFPTQAGDAVFFGPDTYRFEIFLRRHLRPCHKLVDLGCGTGAGGLSMRQRADTLLLADINTRALRYAGINAALSGECRVTLCESDVLRQVPDPFDCVVANPPYIVDDGARMYRDGGGLRGIDIAVRMVEESLARLPRGGQLLMYTGTPIVAGEDPFWQAVAAKVAPHGHTYEELDPDVFGEELTRPAYADADRLAVVGLHVML